MLEENSLTILLASFFYEHRRLAVAGLGRLMLGEEATPVSDEHGQLRFPGGSIVFIFDPNEKDDPGLIDYITDRSRKMRALAASDVSSVAAAARELLNIGQSYTFTGIAKLMPLGNRKFQVVPTPVFPNLLENRGAPVKPAPRTPLPRPPRAARVYSGARSPSMGGLAILAICVAAAAVLVYFLFFTGRSQTAGSAGQQPAYSSAVADTVAPLGNMENDGLLHYEVIFEHAGRDRALQRYRQLTGWGHDVVLHTSDSVRYTLAIPVATAAADTEAVKDSIRVLYGHPVYIRYLQ
jgi:hypothetical protein